MSIIKTAVVLGDLEFDNPHLKRFYYTGCPKSTAFPCFSQIPFFEVLRYIPFLGEALNQQVSVKAQFKAK
jgi:hypothetical protein